jgi:hypothetical protein
LLLLSHRLLITHLTRTRKNTGEMAAIQEPKAEDNQWPNLGALASSTSSYNNVLHMQYRDQLRALPCNSIQPQLSKERTLPHPTGLQPKPARRRDSYGRSGRWNHKGDSNLLHGRPTSYQEASDQAFPQLAPMLPTKRLPLKQEDIHTEPTLAQVFTKINHNLSRFPDDTRLPPSKRPRHDYGDGADRRQSSRSSLSPPRRTMRLTDYPPLPNIEDETAASLLCKSCHRFLSLFFGSTSLVEFDQTLSI